METILASNFIQTEDYQSFIKINPGKGNLKVHAYAAGEALPIEGLHIVVSTIYHNQKILFFEGDTDSSGMIPMIILPAPASVSDNMEIPNTTVYDIEASSSSVSMEYHVNLYDGICVVQNINLVSGGNNVY